MIQKEALDFGSGSFVGEVMRDPSFLDMTDGQLATVLGWANGCPVVNELIDPENTAPGRGPENMVSRYGQVNFLFGHILRSAKEVNPELHAQLVSPVERLASETVGHYEVESVPESYLKEMSPLGTLAGYSLPRLLAKQLGEGLSTKESQARLNRGLSVFEEAIPKAKTPEQLLVMVAEGLSQANVPPEVALSGVLSVGWLKEHGAVSILDKAKLLLENDAPNLWTLYSGMSESEKSQRKIA